MLYLYMGSRNSHSPMKSIFLCPEQQQQDQSSALNNIAIIYSYGFFPEIVITKLDIDTPDV